MAKTALSTIKNWFLTGLKPTQAHFNALLDSFRHKDDKVEPSDVNGLDGLLFDKQDKASFAAYVASIQENTDGLVVQADNLQAHIDDVAAHSGGGGGSSVTLQEITVVAPSGSLGGYNNLDVIPVGTEHEAILSKILRVGTALSFNQPTGNVNSSKGASGLYEIGEVLTMNIGHSFNQNDAGALQNVIYRKDGVDLVDPNAYDLTIGSAGQIIDALIAYAAGSGTKVNQVGEVFTNDIDAGTIDTSNLSYAGQLPFFYGKAATLPTANQALIDAGTKAVSGSLIQSANGTLNINFGASGEFVWFAIPNTAPNKLTYYKTALDTGSIGLIFEAAQVVAGINSPAGFWTAQGYTFYISKGVGTHNTNMQILN